MKNYYQILGLENDCNNDSIKSAYREYAKHFHPDRNQGNEFFASKFIEVKEAYDILIDYQMRRAHDEYHGFNLTSQPDSPNSQSNNTTSSPNSNRGSGKQEETEEIYCDWAIQRLEGNDYYGALEEISNGLKKYPKSPILAHCEGKVQEAFGFYNIARRCYKRAFKAGIIEAKNDIIRIENLFNNAIELSKKHQINGILFCIIGVIIVVVSNFLGELMYGVIIGTIVNFLGAILLSRRILNEVPRQVLDSVGFYSWETNMLSLIMIACAISSAGLVGYILTGNTLF